MRFIHDDGGRSAAGFKGTTGDCVCRAISIASGRPYAEVYAAIAEHGRREPGGMKSRGYVKSSPRTGVLTKRKWFHQYMTALGFVWVPTMQIGSGCTVHLRDSDLPMGRLVVNVSKHMVAVIDGVIHDTHDCSRDGTRCVYGYYQKV